MVSEHFFSRTMVTVKDLATQVEGMENRMVSLQSEFRQELDGINFTVQQLNPKELAVAMAKISHLENMVCALDEGIRDQAPTPRER